MVYIKISIIIQIYTFQNHDGMLSKSEFREGSKCDPWIVQALSMELPDKGGGGEKQ